MSIDTTMDELYKTLVHWLTVSLPAFLLPKLLTFYICIKTVFDLCKRQSYLSFNALYASFDHRYLAFFKLNDQYVPVLMNATDKYTVEPSWIYNMDTGVFTHVDGGLTHRPSNFSYIAASITRNNEADGDMSEWIMEQTVMSNNCLPPLQVVVSAWKYVTETIFMYSFNDYKVILITDDGDELTYDLATEMVVTPDEPSDSSIEEGEIVEEPRGTPTGAHDDVD
jgi:hypothetical protein